ncbi:MAG TPA: DUF2330 domain-containing protein [Kofleriaceae bacterium]
MSAALCAPRAAHAFCGFYVSGSNDQMFNDATNVVLMRDGTRTVLSMQNNYKGPPEAFALVIPVPVVLHEPDVKTLPKDVFTHVDQMGAPRLVEYWEQDPCRPPMPVEPMVMAAPAGAAEEKYEAASPKDLGVKIEAKFTVGEYQILILSAKDSTGLETWLTMNKYQIPPGAEPLLRPYVEAGMKFFVAKVDPTKIAFDKDGRVALSPLRFHYDSEEFALPIRLGLANSSGTQDLIVNILAPHQRYEVSNYPNVMIPTNLDLTPDMKSKFAGFYTALFDKVVQKHPGAVITEYAWQAMTCDPCPGPTLQPGEFATLGADVLEGTSDKPTAYTGYDLVLTRLHARYGKDVTDDLRFKAAEPIVGGREFLGTDGQLEQGAKSDSTNNFQGRYAIRHEWTGPIACEHPTRHVWGGPWATEAASYSGPQSVTNVAFAPRGAVALGTAVVKDIPELGVKAGAANAVAAPTTAGGTTPTASPVPDKTPAIAEKKKSGCGCQASGAGEGGAGAALFLGAVGLGLRRRRPRGGAAR